MIIHPAVIGTGLIPNGQEKQGVVMDTAGLLAGDFAERLDGLESVLNDTSNSCNVSPLGMVKLTDDKFFIAHAYGNNYYLYGTVVTVSGTTMTATTTQLSTTTYSCHSTPQVVKLSETRVFIAHALNSTGNYLYGTIVDIDGTTLTATTEQLSTVNFSGSNCKAVAMSASKVLIVLNYDATDYCLAGMVVDISGTTMTAGTVTKLSTTAKTCYISPSLIKMTSTTAYIAFNAVTNGTTYAYGTINGAVITVSGTTLAMGTPYAHTDAYKSSVAAAKVADGKILLCILSNYSSSGYYVYCGVASVSGTTVSGTIDQKFNDDKLSAWPCMTEMGDGKALIAVTKDRLCFVTVDGTSYTSEEQDFTSSTSASPALIGLTDNIAVAAYATTSGQKLAASFIFQGGGLVAYSGGVSRGDVCIVKKPGSHGDIVGCYVASTD